MPDEHWKKRKETFLRELRHRQWSYVRAQRRALLASCRQLSIRPLRILPASVRKRCKYINDVFADMRFFCGKSEREVFVAVYGSFDDSVARIFWQCIHDIRTCPDEVLTYMEKRIRRTQRYRAYMRSLTRMLQYLRVPIR